MAEWKKVIVSGSDAELNHLVVNTQVSASLFSGSFVGDGSGLSGLAAPAITSYTNAADNRVITSVNSTTVTGEDNLTFNGSTLGVTGTISVDTIGGISGSTDTIHLGNYNGDDINSRINGFGGDHYILQSDGAIEINHPIINLSGIPTGTDNSVVIWNGTTLATDEIDARVWGSTLISGSLTANRIPYASDANTVIDSGNLTFDGSRLTVTGEVSVSSNLTVGGNLYVNGDLTNVNTANLNIEDQFILLASGSVSPVDAGIIFAGVSGATRGAAFFYDAATARLSYAADSINTDDTAVTPSGYVPVAYDTDPAGANQTPEAKLGNIKVDAEGDIFIYG